MCSLIKGGKTLHKTMSTTENVKPSELICEIAANRGMCKNCKCQKEGQMRKTLCQKCKDKDEKLYNECRENECTCLALRLKRLGHSKGIGQYIGKDLMSLNNFLEEVSR